MNEDLGEGFTSSDSSKLEETRFVQHFLRRSQMAFTACNYMQLPTVTLWSGNEFPRFLHGRAWADSAPKRWWHWPLVCVKDIGTRGQRLSLPCNETQSLGWMTGGQANAEKPKVNEKTELKNVTKYQVDTWNTALVVSEDLDLSVEMNNGMERSHRWSARYGSETPAFNRLTVPGAVGNDCNSAFNVKKKNGAGQDSSERCSNDKVCTREAEHVRSSLATIFLY